MRPVPSTHSLFAFALLAFAVIVIPGPSVMFVVSRAIAYGRRAALLTVVGNAAGVYVQVLLVAVGLGALLQRSIAAYNTVKFLGALYLVWIGIQTFRHRRQLAEVADTAAIRGRGPMLIDGFVVGVANPKTIVFLAAVLPQYVQTDGAPAGLQMSVLGIVFVAVALVSDSVWAVATGTARSWLAGSPTRLERLTGAGGLAIAALGVNLAVSRRST